MSMSQTVPMFLEGCMCSCTQSSPCLVTFLACGAVPYTSSSRARIFFFYCLVCTNHTVRAVRTARSGGRPGMLVGSVYTCMRSHRHGISGSTPPWAYARCHVLFPVIITSNTFLAYCILSSSFMCEQTDMLVVLPCEPPATHAPKTCAHSAHSPPRGQPHFRSTVARSALLSRASLLQRADAR